MVASIWDNSVELPSETLLEPIRKSGFYIIRDPLDGPASGEYHVLVINATVNRVRKTYQILWSVSTGAEFFRTADNTGFGEWIERAAGEGGGSTSASLVTFNNAASGLTATNVQNAINEVVTRIVTAEGDITTIEGAIGDLETLVGELETKLDTIEEGAEVNLTASQIVAAIDSQLGSDAWQGGGSVEGTEIDVSVGETTVSIDSSTGSGDTIPAATTEAAGVMTAADKTKLNGIAAGAEVNPSAAAIVSALDTQLGGTDWRVAPPNAAEDISFDPEGTDLEATDVQAAIVELEGLIGEGGGGTDDQTAAEVPYTNSTSGLTATNVQDAIDEVDSDLDTLAGTVSSLAGTVSAHGSKLDGIEAGAEVNPSASEIVSAINGELGGSGWQTPPVTDADGITFNPSGTDLEATDVQAAIEELEDLIGSAGTDDQTAAEVPYTNSTSGLTATNVQDAIDEVDSDLDSIASTVGAHASKLSGIADGANNYTHPNHTGDVTSTGDGATVIANDAVTNAKLANVATGTIKGRVTASTGDPEDLTAAQVRTLLNVEDGATADMTGAEIVAAIDTELGSDDWQSGGGGGEGENDTNIVLAFVDTDDSIAEGDGLQIITFGDEVKDTQGTFNGTRWTPGFNGQIEISTTILTELVSNGGGVNNDTYNLDVRIRKNGVTDPYIGTADVTVNATSTPVRATSIFVSDYCTDEDYYEILVACNHANTNPVINVMEGSTLFGRRTDVGGGGGVANASELPYDNDESGLTASNVQTAIDEIVDEALFAAGENQGPITGGAAYTAKSLGTQSSGTLTVDVADCAFQTVTNGGAFTLDIGSPNGACVLYITNNGSAGAINTSALTLLPGDDFDTTNGSIFRVALERVGSNKVAQISKIN